jgi:hypothetical protein
MDQPNDNTIVTIYANNKKKIQTSYGTVKLNKKLLDLFDATNNSIHVDMNMSSVKIIINYLRGCYAIDMFYKIPTDAKTLGFQFETAGYVYINIGGKIFYLSKQWLVTHFDYFELFFKYNSGHDPDYSNILIDRCCDLFSTLIRTIKLKKSKLIINGTVKQELLFYGPKKHNDSKNMDVITFLSKIHYCRYDIQMHTISDLDINKNLIKDESIGISYHEDTIKIKYNDYVYRNKSILCLFSEKINKEFLKNFNIYFNDTKQDIKFLNVNRAIIFDNDANSFLLKLDQRAFISANKSKNKEVEDNNSINKSNNNEVEGDNDEVKGDMDDFDENNESIKLDECLINIPKNKLKCIKFLSSTCPKYSVQHMKRIKYIYPVKINASESKIKISLIDVFNKDNHGVDRFDIKDSVAFSNISFSVKKYKLSHVELKCDGIIFCESPLEKSSDVYKIKSLCNAKLGINYLLSTNVDYEIIIYLSKHHDENIECDDDIENNIECQDDIVNDNISTKEECQPCSNLPKGKLIMSYSYE